MDHGYAIPPHTETAVARGYLANVLILAETITRTRRLTWRPSSTRRTKSCTVQRTSQHWLGVGPDRRVDVRRGPEDARSHGCPASERRLPAVASLTMVI